MYLTPATPLHPKRKNAEKKSVHFNNDEMIPINYLTPRKSVCLNISNSSYQHDSIRRYSTSFFQNKKQNEFLRQQTFHHDIRGDHNTVILKVSKCIKSHISLARLRTFLLLANLIVLVATYLSFRAWTHVVDFKREYTDHFHINDWLQNPIDIVVQTSLLRIDLFFIVSSCSLSLYYPIFGVIVSYNYGSRQTDQLCTVLSSPIVIIISALQVVMAWICLRIDEALQELNCSLLQHTISYNLLANLIDLKNYMQDHAKLLAIFYIISSLVQWITMLLPWFLYDLPFQRMMNSEEAALRNAAVANDSTRLHLECHSKYLGPCSASLVLIKLCKPELKEFHFRRLMESCD